MRMTSSWRSYMGVLAMLAVAWLGGAKDTLAQGLGLTWDECGAGVSNKTFACDTNVGAETIVVSFTPTFDVPKVVQAQVRMNVCFQGLTMPDWWRVLGSGSCRPGALSVRVEAPGLDCAPAWDPAGGASVKIIQRGVTVLNGFEFVPFVTLEDSSRALDMVVGQPYELMRVILDNSRTVGAGACGGCSIGASVAAYVAWLYTIDGQIINVGSAPSITWQVATTSCRAITPARRATWGAVKTLYR